jgi:MraZ protein
MQLLKQLVCNGIFWGKMGEEMLSGGDNIKLDDTGRIALPRRLRDTLKEDKIVITKGADACIWLFTIEQWKIQEEVILLKTNPFSPRARLMRQHFIGSKEELTIDKQGRILIPPVLRNHAQLSKECIIFGQGGYMEIWSLDRLKAHFDANQDSFSLGLEELGAAMEELGAKIMEKGNQGNT